MKYQINYDGYNWSANSKAVPGHKPSVQIDFRLDSPQLSTSLLNSRTMQQGLDLLCDALLTKQPVPFEEHLLVHLYESNWGHINIDPSDYRNENLKFAMSMMTFGKSDGDVDLHAWHSWLWNTTIDNYELASFIHNPQVAVRTGFDIDEFSYLSQITSPFHNNEIELIKLERLAKGGFLPKGMKLSDIEVPKRAPSYSNFIPVSVSITSLPIAYNKELRDACYELTTEQFVRLLATAKQYRCIDVAASFAILDWIKESPLPEQHQFGKIAQLMNVLEHITGDAPARDVFNELDPLPNYLIDTGHNVMKVLLARLAEIEPVVPGQTSEEERSFTLMRVSSLLSDYKIPRWIRGPQLLDVVTFMLLKHTSAKRVGELFSVALAEGKKLTTDEWLKIAEDVDKWSDETPAEWIIDSSV